MGGGLCFIDSSCGGSEVSVDFSLVVGLVGFYMGFDEQLREITRKNVIMPLYN